jgi:hypothetical protein
VHKTQGTKGVWRASERASDTDTDKVGCILARFDKWLAARARVACAIG